MPGRRPENRSPAAAQPDLGEHRDSQRTGSPHRCAWRVCSESEAEHHDAERERAVPHLAVHLDLPVAERRLAGEDRLEEDERGDP